jgi:hypothetical protein
MGDPTQSEFLPPPADAYQICEGALTDIRVFKRLRPLEPAFVEVLAASMGSTGSRTQTEVADYPAHCFLRHDSRPGCAGRG